MYILLVLWYYFPVSNSYFTPNEITDIIKTCNEICKGHKRAACRKKYTVIVDGECHAIATTSSLRRFLNDCVWGESFRIFRNFDKGATIDLDTKKSSYLSSK